MKKHFKYCYVFYVSILIGLIITSFFIVPSYNMDGYCTVATSFETYSNIFVKAGRYVPALFYMLFEKLNLSFDYVSILSVVFSNIILSLCVNYIYLTCKKYIKNNNKNNFLLFIGSFLICYNPFMIENFEFEESLTMCLAFILCISAVNMLFSQKKGNYFYSFLILLLSSFSYQGMLCMYLPYLLLLLVLKYKNNIFESVKKEKVLYIKSSIVYISTLIVNFLSIKLITIILNTSSAKLGRINILENILSIFKIIIYKISILFRYVNPIVYYSLFLVIFILFFISLKIDKKENNKTIVGIIIMLVISCITCFIPNIAMDSDANYSAPRMVNSIGAILGYMCIYATLFFNNRTKFKNVLVVITSICFAYICYCYLKNSYYYLNRYYNDKIYANNIQNSIDIYEKKSGFSVKYIYYSIYDNVEYHYKELKNGANIRFYAVDWGFECGINSLLNKNYIVKKDDIVLDRVNVYNNYFYEDDKLYILLK